MGVFVFRHAIVRKAVHEWCEGKQTHAIDIDLDASDVDPLEPKYERN